LRWSRLLNIGIKDGNLLMKGYKIAKGYINKKLPSARTLAPTWRQVLESNKKSKCKMK
jgi:hypothetical protein